MMSAVEVKLSASRARRLALGAQGFGVPRPSGRVDRRHVRRMLARVGLIQIDSVNVIVRSQELPLFSRLGPHRRDLLMGMVEDGELFEYWGHEASLLPIELFPLLRWRMDAAGAKAAGWTGLIILATERPDYVEAVYEEVRERGLTSASELDDPGAKSGPWWGWRHGKQALEYLFWSGRLSARRRASFERMYDLTERLIPPEWFDAPAPSGRARKSTARRTSAPSASGRRPRRLLPAQVHGPCSPSSSRRPVVRRRSGWSQPAYLPGGQGSRRIRAARCSPPTPHLGTPASGSSTSVTGSRSTPRSPRVQLPSSGTAPA
jgi:uncharacterized protein YcaQ